MCNAQGDDTTRHCSGFVKTENHSRLYGLTVIFEGCNELTNQYSTLWSTTSSLYTNGGPQATRTALIFLLFSFCFHLFIYFPLFYAPYFKYTLNLLYYLNQCSCINHLRKRQLAICQLYFIFTYILLLSFFYISLSLVYCCITVPI